MTTIYAELLKLGYTDEQIRDEERKSVYNTQPRMIGLALQDTPDGVPIVGLNYRCDYRSEEEYGSVALAKAFRNSKDQSKLTRWEGGVLALFDESWGSRQEESRQFELAQEHYLSALPYAQKSPATKFRWMNVKEMRAYAREHNVDLKGLRTKVAILERLTESVSAEHPNIWPAWFHYGNVLIMRAGSGIIRDVLGLLFKATAYNTLGVGGGGRVFGSGLSLFDKRDVGPLLQAEWDEHDEFVRQSMEALEPVKQELKSRGHNWFYLGNPKMISTKDGQEPQVRYWLNGMSRGGRQPFGWYSLEELLAEKFIEDINAYHEQQKAERS